MRIIFRSFITDNLYNSSCKLSFIAINAICNNLQGKVLIVSKKYLKKENNEMINNFAPLHAYKTICISYIICQLSSLVQIWCVI